MSNPDVSQGAEQSASAGKAQSTGGADVVAEPSEAALHAAMDAFYPGEDWRTALGGALDTSLRDMRAALSAAALAAPTAKGGTIPNIWHVVICLPGLNIDHYLAFEDKPTHDQIEALWRAKHPNDDRPVRPRGWDGPLRDAYPGVALVERIEVQDIRAASPPPPAGAAGGGSGDLGALSAAIIGISDDYMTSETHHPGYVVIPNAKFEELCEAEKRLLASAPTPLAVDEWPQNPAAEPWLGRSWESLNYYQRQDVRAWYQNRDPGRRCLPDGTDPRLSLRAASQRGPNEEGSSYPTRNEATRAGRAFFAEGNGTLGVEGSDFHVRQIDGRWHFEAGRDPASN